MLKEIDCRLRPERDESRLVATHAGGNHFAARRIEQERERVTFALAIARYLQWTRCALMFCASVEFNRIHDVSLAGNDDGD